VPNKEQASYSDIKQYQEEISSLIYLAINTRPNIAFIVGLLARFMSNPSIDHFRAINIVWQYLVYSLDLGIEISTISTKNSL